MKKLITESHFVKLQFGDDGEATLRFGDDGEEASQKMPSSPMGQTNVL